MTTDRSLIPAPPVLSGGPRDEAAALQRVDSDFATMLECTLLDRPGS